MIINELKEKLIRENIPKDSYCLDGGYPNEAYCIEVSGDGWLVYYSERGIKSGVIVFTSEEEACECFYTMLIEILL